MTLLALALALTSAAAHAGWNVLAKRSSDGGIAFAWLAAAVSAALLTPPVLVLAAGTGAAVSGEALAWIAGSGALHAAYFALLGLGYRHGELSVVYPLARGSAPLLSTAAAIALLGERPGAPALAGALLIAGAIVWIGGRGGRGGGDARTGVAYALATGLLIATYTVWDKHGVDGLGVSPLVYLWGIELGCVAFLAPAAAGAIRREWALRRRDAIGFGVLGPSAYLLVLFALTLAPVSVVAPARESSVLIAAALGARVLGEPAGAARHAAAAAIVLGIAGLALGS